MRESGSGTGPRRRVRGLLAWVAAWLWGMAVPLGPALPAALRAQEAGPVTPDSADALRAAMEQPPARPPGDVHDILALPVKVAILPLAAVAYGTRALLALAFRPDRPPNPVIVALGGAREWGASPQAGTLGPRSGVAGGLRLERFEPFWLESGLSIRGSQRHAVGVALGDGAGRPGGGASVAFRRFAEPHFFGVGPSTLEEDVTDFRWDQVDVTAGGRIPTRPVTWKLSVGWEENDVGRGFDDEVPDLQDVADPETLFGLEERTRYARLGAGMEIDLTRWRGLQRRGLWGELAGTAYLGVGGTDSDFLRWEGELVGYVPLNPRQQLAVRALAELNRAQGGRGVPFTHLASLGGDRGLRGFDVDRFRDEDLLALLSEWRYEIWRTIHDDLRQEGFVFLDVGTVGGISRALDLSDLRTSYGFGMRTVAAGTVAFVWYVGFSEEQTAFRVGFSWPW